MYTTIYQLKCLCQHTGPKLIDQLFIIYLLVLHTYSDGWKMTFENYLSW